MEAALRDEPGRGFSQPADAAARPVRRRAFGGRPSRSAGSWRCRRRRSVAAIVWSGQAIAPAPVASRAITSVAVLPLSDVSGPSATPYLADALTDQLITTLGHVEALRVVIAHVGHAVQGRRPSIEQVFETLGVDAIVEGTVAVVPEASGPCPAACA